jgi:hypothetical protein
MKCTVHRTCVKTKDLRDGATVINGPDRAINDIVIRARSASGLAVESRKQ